MGCKKPQLAISFAHNSVLSFNEHLSDLWGGFVSSSESIANFDNHPSADATHSLAIDAVLASKLSFASHQNAVPVLRDLRILNLGTTVLENIKVEISADPTVFDTKQWQIDRILPGGEAHISKRDLKLNAGLLLQLSEAINATVTLRAWVEGAAEQQARRDFPVELLARHEWGGALAMPELLAAFALPNDPATGRLLKAASEVLRRGGRTDTIEGYQSKSRSRVHELASAIWSAVCGLRLTYAEPPASFELQGQKVRTPSQVLETGLGTCLDTALLFAAALEQAGLYPVIVITKGHAFTGVWLQPQEFATLLVQDAASLRKRVALQELVLFETTMATGAAPAAFSQAIAQANRQIGEEREDEFVLALDIRRARMQRLRPLAMMDDTGASPSGEGAGIPDPAGDALEAAPALPDFDLVEPEAAPVTAEGRLVRWQRKLLELTTRNRLLNVKEGPTAIRLICPDPAALEDRLANGTSFRIIPAPVLEGAAGRDLTLHQQRSGEVLDETYAREALDKGEILSLVAPEKLDAQLIELYRKTQLDLAEGGANTLFLAVGFLLWRKSESDARQYRAPLILLPVKLERRSVRSGVKLSLHEDEPRFNLTLLQMLRQDFDLDIPELAGALPMDEAGIDVTRIWNLVRRAVRDTPGFEVATDVMLGSFSFAKYLMWKDLVDRTETLKRSPVVRHLLETPREPYQGAEAPPHPHQLDVMVGPEELFTPLPADSSQLSAVVGSARGSDFVLDGPPGTGKSQTIANMIAHNLALGRKVLFVAEKRAALEVVHRRLVAHGLGPFCLELHSNKASKQAVLQQLDSAWTTAADNPAEVWKARAAELKTSRDQLNRLVAALHHRHPNGMSLYAAIGRVVRDGDGQAFRLPWPPMLQHRDGDLERLREAARHLDLHRPQAGKAALFAPVGQTEWSNAWQAELLVNAAALGRAAVALQAARERLLSLLGIQADADQQGLAALAFLVSGLLPVAGLDIGFAFGADAVKLLEQAPQAIALVCAYQEEEKALSRPLEPAFVKGLPLAELEAAWTQALKAIWPLSIFRKKAVATRLDPSGGLDPAADLPRLRRLQGLLGQLDEFNLLSVLPGWAGVTTDLGRFNQLLKVAGELRQSIAGAARTPDQLIDLRGAMRRLCVDANDMLATEGPIGRAGQHYLDAHASFASAKAAFEHSAASPAPIDGVEILQECKAIADNVKVHAAQLNSWAAWQRAKHAAHDLDLGALVTAMENGAIPPGQAVEAFDIAYARWWAEAAIDAEPLIRGFTVAAHMDSIRRFQEMDREFAELTRLYIRARIAGGIPPKDAKAPPAGFGALAHQLKLQKRHKPLRQLVAEMGEALTTLTPCLLMSPLSVAQYLPPDAAPFDLVIFDEASQITPWDAVGAMARGQQVVVAGDPKQMPPTSFFERGAGADDDDGEMGADQESILEECLGARLPQRRLSWHYRSRHESLIAFSNHHYYDGDLITFPAPVTRNSMVSLRQVPGAWSRGKSRTNQIEAEAIVQEAVRRLLDPGFVDEQGRRLTLAVITLNAEQQKLIEDLLDKARRQYPELEPYFAEDEPEKVVVKNLETVQGDERDLILLGIAYGPETPDAPFMAMNFGPLNRSGGWRRLNVAITRARREMMVFTSFPPGLIDLNRTSADAVRDLKHFLEYAERGPRALGEAVAGSVGGFDSPFEQAVARALRQRGWTIVPQIGVSRFRIDLGVVHPDRPGDFLAGVECDGATYHSAATARDRDKVREEVLKSLGWTLLRVWSTDWWVDAQGASDRLDTALRQLLEQARAIAPPPVEPALPPVIDLAFPQEQEPETATAPEPVAEILGGDYRITDLSSISAIAPDRFYEADYLPVLKDLVLRVVMAEAPIRDNLLVERIARAHGFKRSIRQIRDRVLSVARAVAHLETEPSGSAFIWIDAMAPAAWDRARYPASSNDIRMVEDIALPELAAAIKGCVSVDAPLIDVARQFGIRRISSVARERIKSAQPEKGHIRS
jgi:very-short-patch-repair endonuclease